LVAVKCHPRETFETSEEVRDDRMMVVLKDKQTTNIVIVPRSQSAPRTIQMTPM